MLFPYRFANILMVSGSKPDGALDPADSHLIAQMCHNIEPHAPVTALRESFHGPVQGERRRAGLFGPRWSDLFFRKSDGWLLVAHGWCLNQPLNWTGAWQCDLMWKFHGWVFFVYFFCVMKSGIWCSPDPKGHCEGMDTGLLELVDMFWSISCIFPRL